MNKAISPNKLGLVFALLLGGIHLLWAALVALGVGQMILDFLFWAHFLKPAYAVGPFQILTAAILVLVTAGSGYVSGLLLGLVWNRVHT